MKINFKKSTPNYIGDYFVEFKKAGLLRHRSIEEVLIERKSVSTIRPTMVDLYALVCDAIKDHENGLHYKRDFENTGITDLEQFLNFLNKYPGNLTQEEYEVIEELLTDENKSKTKKDLYYYIDDRAVKNIDSFCFFVMYAKKYCFNAFIESREKMQLVVNDNERRKLKNFIVQMYSDEGVDVEYIKIKGDYSLTIKSPTLIKMMIYEFAKKYFHFFEREDTESEDEDWENNIPLYKDKKKGRRENSNKRNLITLIEVYLYFAEEKNIFAEKTHTTYKHYLIARLLNIAGLPEFEDFESTFCGPKPHFDHIIRNILRTNQRKK